MDERNELGGAEEPEAERTPPAESLTLLKDAEGRIRRHSSHGLSEAQAADVDLAIDGVVTQSLTKRVAAGVASDAAGQAPQHAHEEAAPRSPVESMLLRSMVLASAQQRQLLSLSANAKQHGNCQRYANLGLRAAREVARAAAVWDALRKPPAVRLGPGSQANVVGGSQSIYQGVPPESDPDESPDD